VSEQKVCPTCGTEYPLSERFCPRDGTALRSSNPQADLVGSIVAERYHILKKLGEGGMGSVYLAEHVKMGRKAALKVMNPGMAQDPDAIARFNREAANASRLNHPNICGIYDFGETPDGMIYLAMEFIEGASLTSLIEKSGALPAPRAAGIIHQAADALQVAHDYGIVHRDLKPDNIMVAKGRDGSDNVKVVDFGIAKASSSDAQKVTKTGLVVGTPEYMSPEQLAGDKLDGRSDIYSLGLVAFNCLTGTLPFPSNSVQEAMIMRLTDQPKTLAEMKPEVEWPAELQAVMDKALARDAAERYQSAAQFGRDIAKAVENMPQAVAAGAATQVMGATPAAGAKTVAAPAAAGVVPRTRVATSPADAGAAVAPAAAKSKMPMLVGIAAVVVAGVGYGVMKMMSAGGAAAPTSTATQPPAAESAKAAPALKTPADPQLMAKGPKQPPDAGRGRASGAAPATDPTPGGAPMPADPTAALSRLEVILSADGATEAQADAAFKEVAPIISGARGEVLGRAYFVQMLGHIVAKDSPARICAAAKSAEQYLKADDGRRDVAKAAKDEAQCK